MTFTRLYKLCACGCCFIQAKASLALADYFLTVQGHSITQLFEQQAKGNWFLLCIDNISPATSPSIGIALSLRRSNMDKYLDGTWEEFEQWIRFTIGSDFMWRVRPLDRRSNRQMVADTVRTDTKKNNGVFPAHNSFIERK
jgi:hypothetical protein